MGRVPARIGHPRPGDRLERPRSPPACSPSPGTGTVTATPGTWPRPWSSTTRTRGCGARATCSWSSARSAPSPAPAARPVAPTCVDGCQCGTTPCCGNCGITYERSERHLRGGLDPPGADLLPPRHGGRVQRAIEGRPRGRRARAPRTCRQPAAGNSQGPRLHPDPRDPRLVGRRAHGGRDRHRRHAVPGRLRHGGPDPGRPRYRSGRAPADRGAARHHRRAARHRGCPGPRPRRPDPRRRIPRVLDAPGDRPGVRGRDGPDRGRAAPGAARRPRRRRGLAEDGRGRAASGRRPDRRGGHARPGDRPGDRRGVGTAALVGRQPLHLPRLPRVRPVHRGRPGRPGRGAPRRPRHRTRHHARRRAALEVLRRPHPGRPGPGTRLPAADHYQVHDPLDRAPSRVPGLHRGEEVRRRRGRRRAAVRRAVQPRRLHRERRAHPGAAPQGRRALRADRLHPEQLLRARPARGDRNLSARRAVPDPGAAAVQGAARGAAPQGAQAASPVPALGRVRPLRLRAGLPAARPLQHREPAQDPGDPARPARRNQRRVHLAGDGVRAGSPALRGPHRPVAADRAPAADGRRPGRGRAGRGHPDLARIAAPSPRGALRGARRGDADGALRRGLPGRLSGVQLPLRRGRRPDPHRSTAPRRRHLRAALRTAQRRHRAPPVLGVPARAGAFPVGNVAGAAAPRRRGHRRAALPDRAGW